jgi:hypothetical protein
LDVAPGFSYDTTMWGRLALAYAVAASACTPGSAPSRRFDAPPLESATDASDDSPSPSVGTECGGLLVGLTCPDAGGLLDGGTCGSPAPLGGFESDGGFAVGCVAVTDEGSYGLDGACVVPTWTCQGSPPRWVGTTSNLSFYTGAQVEPEVTIEFSEGRENARPMQFDLAAHRSGGGQIWSRSESGSVHPTAGSHEIER